MRCLTYITTGTLSFLVYSPRLSPSSLFKHPTLIFVSFLIELVGFPEKFRSQQISERCPSTHPTFQPPTAHEYPEQRSMVPGLSQALVGMTADIFPSLIYRPGQVADPCDRRTTTGPSPQNLGLLRGVRGTPDSATSDRCICGRGGYAMYTFMGVSTEEAPSLPISISKERYGNIFFSWNATSGGDMDSWINLGDVIGVIHWVAIRQQFPWDYVTIFGLRGLPTIDGVALFSVHVYDIGTLLFHIDKTTESR
ncbi:uncharacterized protein EV420DRAFT_1639667 [Desarmillaria tabescens]|uniref:Uncharacterized protein n=1 Tax=Armillaria tabescens TaxID=1929756 RepID=A0AA39NB84_ARMTA|nr:uncharacterized protein EV420DRAFT_1639667 [Desarmillaria tabescens]KAK0462445.1 hypothetical protein EV420DRAFT_1639667 [Desarmillaria tabescens]